MPPGEVTFTALTTAIVLHREAFLLDTPPNNTTRPVDPGLDLVGLSSRGRSERSEFDAVGNSEFLEGVGDVGFDGAP